MDTRRANAVLRRKASVAREVWQARAMSPAKALKLALARAADDVLDLPLAVASVAEEEVARDDLVQAMTDGDLLILLDGPDGATGALSMAFPVMSGVVEMQTMGRVGPRPAEPRPATRTDSAIAAPLVDAMLERLEETMQGQEGAAHFRGYRFGVMLDNLRMLTMALEGADFRRYAMQVDLAGQRQGAMVLCLPICDPAPDRAEGAAEEGDIRGLGAVVMEAEARLDAVLWRIRMPLAEAGRLQPGDLLEIPRSALADTALVSGQKGRVAEGRLGQINGFRAVRLTEGGSRGGPVDPAARAGAEEAGPVPPGLPPDPPAYPLPDPMPRMADAVEDDPMDDLPDLDDLPGLGGFDLSEEEGMEDLPPLPDLSDLPDLEG
ncbi:FliM/FliN family flagellar motor switch protein [Pseudooceanicola pacificus]|nr:FliM/FliN family flagellar motor C-terminal domain-containing protein [Pseudooceanicola pacificus]